MAVTALREYLGDRSMGMVPVLTAISIGRGAAVGDNGSGYARELVAGDPFLGFAEEDVDTTGASSGDWRIRVHRRGRVKLAVTGVTGVGDQGDTVYASGANAFTLTSTSNTAIGKISEWISGTTCWVDFESIDATSR